MAREISAEALAHLQRWEGLVLYAYNAADGSHPKRFIGPGDAVMRGRMRVTKPAPRRPQRNRPQGAEPMAAATDVERDGCCSPDARRQFLAGPARA